MKRDVIIIGGGVAGLATGAMLAKAGRSVAVLEKGNQAGGRAYCYVDRGFTLNYGPHAMFRPYTGLLAQILERIEKPRIECNFPDVMRSYWADGDRFAALGAKPHQMITTKLFPPATRLRLARLMAELAMGKSEPPEGQTFGEWVDERTRDQRLRRFLLALATVNTYTRPSSALSARFVVGAIRRNVLAKDYAGYMHGGWKTMHDTFLATINEHGGDVFTGMHAERLEYDGERIVAVVADGRRFEADAFVCTLPPDDAASLPDAGTPLAAEMAGWTGMQDVRAVCIDLGLSRRVRTDLTFVYDIERDLYFSAHSEVTPDLAPPGNQLLLAMAYLSPEESASDSARAGREAELRAGLDRYFEGWRDAVVVERVLPNALVTPARRTPDQKGVPARAASASNLWFANDSRDTLYNVSEGSLASAIEVADAVLATPAIASAPAPQLATA